MKGVRKVLFSIFILLVSSGYALAAAAEVPPAGVDFKTFTVLIGVILALFTLAWAAKKYGPYTKMKKALGLNVLGQIPVGAKAHLSLVRVGKSILLLGVTQNNVSLIKDMGEGDFEKTMSGIELPEGGE